MYLYLSVEIQIHLNFKSAKCQERSKINYMTFRCPWGKNKSGSQAGKAQLLLVLSCEKFSLLGPYKEEPTFLQLSFTLSSAMYEKICFLTLLVVSSLIIKFFGLPYIVFLRYTLAFFWNMGLMKGWAPRPLFFSLYLQFLEKSLCLFFFLMAIIPCLWTKALFSLVFQIQAV